MVGQYGDSVAFWLRQAYLVQRRVLDEVLAEHGLSAALLDILWPLWDHDGIEQRELQEIAGVTSPTLTRLLDGLVERHLIERRPHSEDARAKLIFLTDEGYALRTTLGATSAQFMTRALAGFSQPETQLLREWLRRIATNLSSPSLF